MQYTVYQYPEESLPDLTVQQLNKGTTKDAQLTTVSEHAYDQYVRLMHKEQEPELLITLPQQQDAAAADRDSTPAPATADSTPHKSGTPSAAATPKQGPPAVAADAAAATPAPAPAAGANTPRAASP